MTIQQQNARPSWVKFIAVSIAAALILGYMFLHQRLMTMHMRSRLLVEQDQQQLLKQQSRHGKDQPPQVATASAQTLRKLSIDDLSEEKNKPYDIANRQELASDLTQEKLPKLIEWLPPCNIAGGKASDSSSSPLPFWIECDPGPQSIDVILTVYRRPNLRLQLEMLVNQTLQPQNIFVYQSEHFIKIDPIVEAFQSDFTYYKVPIHVLQAPVDFAGYHGRFYMAYTMSRARYVSIWDDDLSAGAGWLERVATFLNENKDMYIASSGGRIVQSLVDPISSSTPIASKNKKDHDSQESNTFGMLGKRHGKVDFCVHNYNLRRELLTYWLGSPVHTYYTGEDMQLAYALQQYGVHSYKLGQKLQGENDWADGAKGLGANNRNKASYKTKRSEPRQWLICKLVAEGFQTIICSNCNSTVAKRCMDYYEHLNVSANSKKG